MRCDCEALQDFLCLNRKVCFQNWFCRPDLLLSSTPTVLLIDDKPLFLSHQLVHSCSARNVQKHKKISKLLILLIESILHMTKPVQPTSLLLTKIVSCNHQCVVQLQTNTTFSSFCYSSAFWVAMTNPNFLNLETPKVGKSDASIQGNTIAGQFLRHHYPFRFTVNLHSPPWI